MPALKYTLGLGTDQEITISLSVDYTSESFNSTGHFLEAKYLPDINNWVNDMFIYCDQLEGIPVGNTISELLCIVPIDKKQGEGETVSYAPPSTNRRFKKVLSSLST